MKYSWAYNTSKSWPSINHGSYLSNFVYREIYSQKPYVQGIGWDEELKKTIEVQEVQNKFTWGGEGGGTENAQQ